MGIASLHLSVVLVVVTSFTAIIEASSPTSDSETDLPRPSSFVYPSPEDPDPGRNWDEYHSPKCKVSIPNYRSFAPLMVKNEEVFPDLEGDDCLNSYINMCRDETRYPNPEDRKLCEVYNQNVKEGKIASEKDNSRALDERLREDNQLKELILEANRQERLKHARDQSMDPAKPTTESWRPSPTNAHIAFDKILIMRGSATTTIAKSAVITIPPTPVESTGGLMKRINELQVEPPAQVSHKELRQFSDFARIVASEKCLAVYAGLDLNQEDFFSWLANLDGKHPAPRQKGVDPVFNLDDLAMSPGLLLNLTGHPHKEINKIPDPITGNLVTTNPFSHTCAPDDPYWAFIHNSSRYSSDYRVPVCFFSGKDPLASDNQSPDGLLVNTLYAAVVKYSWWTGKVSTPSNIALRALAVSDPQFANLTECELEDEFPKLRTLPPLTLGPVSGGMITAPELRWRSQLQQPQEEDRRDTHAPEQPASAQISVNVPTSGVTPGGKGTSVSSAPSNGNTHVVPMSIPLPTITIGSQQVQPIYVGRGGSPPAVVIGTKTMTLNGPAATVNGATVSFNPQGLIVDTKTIPVVPELAIDLGTEQARVVFDKQNLIILGSSTITATGSEYTIASQVLRFAAEVTGGSGTSTSPFSGTLQTTTTLRKFQRVDALPTSSPTRGMAKARYKSENSMGTHGYGRPGKWPVLGCAAVFSAVLIF